MLQKNSMKADDSLPTPDVKLAAIGGLCPVQAEGAVNGLPFYFRARGGGWTFSVASTPDGDPVEVSLGWQDGFSYGEEYGDGPYDAGWMTEAEARAFIEKAAALFAAQTGETPETEQDDTCCMCGSDLRLTYVAGVGLVCSECDETEFGPHDSNQEDFR